MKNRASAARLISGVSIFAFGLTGAPAYAQGTTQPGASENQASADKSSDQVTESSLLPTSVRSA